MIKFKKEFYAFNGKTVKIMFALGNELHIKFEDGSQLWAYTDDEPMSYEMDIAVEENEVVSND